MNVKRFLRNNPYLFALLLVVILIVISGILQRRFYNPGVIATNLRGLLPLMFLAIGQAMVIIGGGVDLSVGAIVSVVNTVLVIMITPESGPGQIFLGILVGCAVGVLAGVLNGFCIAWLRLQPIVTTYATSFIFAGLALLILPRPGGSMPSSLTSLYRSMPLSIPFAIFVIAGVLLLWTLVRRSRFGQYVYAMGGSAEAAYTTGLAVTRLRWSVYMIAGFCSALAALALTLETGSGSPRIGDAMTLESIVAIVLGGTRLSGGQGGVVGTILGVAILRLVRPIVPSIASDSNYQTLVYALIILTALVLPSLLGLFRRRR